MLRLLSSVDIISLSTDLLLKIYVIIKKIGKIIIKLTKRYCMNDSFVNPKASAIEILSDTMLETCISAKEPTA